jgi:hypothetical protein
MTQKTLVMGGKHLTIGEPGIPTTLNCILSEFSSYHLFAQLFDGGFAPQLYANLKVYVAFLPL